MIDRFNRTISYLRISVTDRCNLRCVYCMPQEGVPHLCHEDLLTFEEIVDVTKTAVSMGVNKVRLTGGEPLVRKDVLDLVSMVGAIEGIEDLSMTTNGTLLDKFSRPLKQAGLHRINISLDALDPDRYRSRTRGGDLSQVLAGIEAAQTAGLHPIKINCVIEESSDEPDAKAVREFGEQRGFEVRFIRRMDFATGAFWQVQGGTGGDCSRCNRLRLSSDGYIRPCLFSDKKFCVRKLGARRAIQQALQHKPRSGKKSSMHSFSKIGG